jgi:hypothetical protein
MPQVKGLFFTRSEFFHFSKKSQLINKLQTHQSLVSQSLAALSPDKLDALELCAVLDRKQLR